MERPMAYMGDQPYIFISYSHKDSERVWPIILKLQSEGFRIWYDDGISPGTEWDADIASHIRKCSFFAAFISRNYLESDNCKDELSFVRDLKKNRVLIYLEDVTLPDEMQMRLGRLQAIYWSRLGENKAFKKFLMSPGLNVCREPAAMLNDCSPESENPAETEPTQANTVSAQKNPLIFAGIGAAILLVLVVVFFMKPSNPSETSESAASAQSLPDEGSDTAQSLSSEGSDTAQGIPVDGLDNASGMLSVYKNGVFVEEKGSPFAGILTAKDGSSPVLKAQQKLDYKGDTYIVSPLPFITISSYDDKNSMILGFYDEFDAAFYFYGTYTIDGNYLIITPGGSAGSFDQNCAPLTQELKYEVAIQNNYIEISNADSKVKLIGYSEDDNIIKLKGSLSEGSEPYNGLQSLDLVLDSKNNTLEKCTLIFSDGDITASAVISGFTYYSNIHNSNIHTLLLKWDSIEYTLNGRQVSKDQYGSISISYINQYPAGFTVINDDGSAISYYQDL